MPAFLAGIILSCYLSCGSIVIVLFSRPRPSVSPLFPGALPAERECKITAFKSLCQVPRQININTSPRFSANTLTLTGFAAC